MIINNLYHAARAASEVLRNKMEELADGDDEDD